MSINNNKKEFNSIHRSLDVVLRISTSCISKINSHNAIYNVIKTFPPKGYTKINKYVSNPKIMVCKTALFVRPDQTSVKSL